MLFKKKLIDYKFSCYTPSDFELTFDMETSETSAQLLYTKVISKLKKMKMLKEGQEKDIKKIKKFNIPDFYYNFIGTKLKKQIKKAFKDVNKDGIKVIHHKVSHAIVFLDNDIWKMKVWIKGYYTKEG